MNPSLNIAAYEDRVGQDTENIFDDTFYYGVDVVVNALDNVDARMFVCHPTFLTNLCV